MTLIFAALLIMTLVLAAVPDWQPLPKGEAMKALFATVLTAALALMAVWAYAAPLCMDHASLSVPAADDDDKDKEKDKKGD